MPPRLAPHLREELRREALGLASSASAAPVPPKAADSGSDDALIDMLEQGWAREHLPDFLEPPAVGWQRTRVVRRGHDGGEAAPVTVAGSGLESYLMLADSPGPNEGGCILSAAQVGERCVGILRLSIERFVSVEQ